MKPMDVLAALGIAVSVLALTLAASYPMVGFYATFVEPGHPHQFYVDAAQWIAPWSSHILGPILFFGLNAWHARRAKRGSPYIFALGSIAIYAVVDLGSLPLMGFSLLPALNLTMGLSLLVKTAGALLGASLGARRRSRVEAAAL
jgi:hypothetical protein